MISIFSLTILINSFFTDPNLQLEVAAKFSLQKRYEESERILDNVDYRKLNFPDRYSYFRLLNNFTLNKKSDAIKYSKQLQDYLNTSLPERYKCLSYLMIEDLKTWKDNDLNDIARDMEGIQERLSNNQGGKETQRKQKEVISKLDFLIKQLEDKKKAAQDKESAKEEAKKKREQEERESANNQPNPQKDSKSAQDIGPGQIDFKKLRKLSVEWGKLPPREREANMRELLIEIPPRYREVVNEYFRKQSNQ